MSLYTYDSTELIGKVGRDAEMRYMPNGNAITSFSVAVDRSYKKDGEQIKRTIWYRISVYGKFAEVCRNITKGETLFIRGELQADWTTGAPKVYSKQDGTSGASFELNATEIRFLSPKSERTETTQTAEVEEAPF